MLAFYHKIITYAPFAGLLVFAVRRVFIFFYDEVGVHFYERALFYYHHKNCFPEQNLYHEVLSKKFRYYEHLEEPQKRKFISRMKIFLRNKKFHPREIDEVTEEMKILIAASAVQLTFGLTRYTLRHFGDIYIYPDAYQGHPRMPNFRGHVHEEGTISFSWKHFEHGYLDHTDARNLGLHEMSHAVILNFTYYDAHLSFFGRYKEWFEHGKRELIRFRNGQTDFLRSYASTNLDEFLAVSMEAFFEVPEQFKKEMPELFEMTRYLFRQDPSIKHNPLSY